MRFPKIVTKDYLNSLTSQQIKEIQNYANQTKSHTKYLKNKPDNTIAKYCQDLANDGGILVLSRTGKVYIKGWSHDKFTIYSPSVVICFYALNQK